MGSLWVTIDLYGVSMGHRRSLWGVYGVSTGLYRAPQISMGSLWSLYGSLWGTIDLYGALWGLYGAP